MCGVIFTCQQQMIESSSNSWDGWSGHRNPTPTLFFPPLTLTSTLISSIIHRLDIVSLGWRKKGYDWSIIPTCFINHPASRDQLESCGRVRPEGVRPRGFGETWLRSGKRKPLLATVLYMWLEWLCDVTVASLMFCQWPRVGNMHTCTWQLG